MESNATPPNTSNPFQSSVLPTDAPRSTTALSRYGKLAQRKLQYARIALFVVGVFGTIVALVALVNAPREVDQATRDLGAHGLRVDAQAMLTFAYTVYGIMTASGLLFLVLGGLTPRWPRASILAGLIVYLAMQGMGVYLEPTSIIRGLIFKLIIVYALFQGTWIAFSKRES